MQDIMRLLPALLLKADESEEGRKQAVLAGWMVAAGLQLNKATAALTIERKRLIVAVRDSTWQTQLRKMKPELVFRVNSILGDKIITGIDFIVNPGQVQAAHPAPLSIVFRDLDLQKRALSGPASRIDDEELRETFLRAAAKCLDRTSGLIH